MFLSDLGLGELEGRGVPDEVYMIIHRVEGLRRAQKDRECLVVDELVDLGGELTLPVGVYLPGEPLQQPLEFCYRWSPRGTGRPRRRAGRA